VKTICGDLKDDGHMVNMVQNHGKAKRLPKPLFLKTLCKNTDGTLKYSLLMIASLEPLQKAVFVFYPTLKKSELIDLTGKKIPKLRTKKHKDTADKLVTVGDALLNN
jgi:hypothetical protein